MPQYGVEGTRAKLPRPHNPRAELDYYWALGDKGRRDLLYIAKTLYNTDIHIIGDKRRDLANLLNNVVISDLMPLEDC